MQNPQLFTEVFPVDTSAIPQLFAYRIDAGRGDLSIIGGKLSYRLRKTFQGHWVWIRNRIITDTHPEIEEIRTVVEALWKEQADVFKDLRDVQPDVNWHPDPQSQAEFVARGSFLDVESRIRQILAEKNQDLGNAHVERVHDLRGWVVQGKPAVSISISSRLIHREGLKTYYRHLSDVEDLVGMWVIDQTSALKGEIIEIVGTVEEHRKRLLALTRRPEMYDVITRASADEPVVSVLSGRIEYDYVVSALGIIVRNEDFRRFKINSQQALKALRIDPEVRSRLIKPIADLAKQRNLLLEAYNSNGSPNLFLNAADVGYRPQLCFGGNQVQAYSERTLLGNLREYGLYKRSDMFSKGVPINIGVLNGLGTTRLEGFWSSMRKELRGLDFDVNLIGAENLSGFSRSHLEKAVDTLWDSKPHILLALLPDDQDEDDEGWGAYHIFKSLTISRGIPGQVVYRSTINKQFAIGNIVLGVLSKIGNIPFILGGSLDYADLVVGIDIARQRKERLPGSVSATAIARIYFGNGEFLRYVISDSPLEGETIPEQTLQSLFPINEFKGKRVIIHRDGYFRGGERQVLSSWGQQIGAEFHLVEVIKSGTPRIYASRAGNVQQPPKASAFKLNDTEAFVVSSLPPTSDTTPRPLRIRSERSFPIEKAIHSVLSLTLLHYGSLRPPRLPVTIHYSDRIAYLALKGFKPRDLEGNDPFWL